MYKCEWYVSAEQPDPFNNRFRWKVSFFLSLEGSSRVSAITTMFTVDVERAFNESEAIEIAFESLDERHITSDG